jgi:hypothetical protein
MREAADPAGGSRDWARVADRGLRIAQSTVVSDAMRAAAPEHSALIIHLRCTCDPKGRVHRKCEASRTPRSKNAR